jgi:hypothetical protein
VIRRRSRAGFGPAGLKRPAPIDQFTTGVRLVAPSPLEALERCGPPGTPDREFARVCLSLGWLTPEALVDCAIAALREERSLQRVIVERGYAAGPRLAQLMCRRIRLVR